MLHALRARWLVVSFSDEGYIAREEMETMLGEKVGRVSHVRNTEFLYLVGPDREALRRAAEEAAGPRQLELA